jgi:glutathione reductase (NADPH)
MARKMLKDDGDVPMPDADRYDYNLFVIGAGSGGVRGSRTAASFGVKVPLFLFHLLSP